MKKTGIASVILAAGLLWFGAMTVSAETGSTQEQAMEGIYIENMNVSGMHDEEIQQAVQGKMEKLSASVIELYVGEASYAVTAGELGLTYTNDTVVSQALQLGQKGNVLQRFHTHRAMEKNGPYILELDYTVDQEKVKAIIEEKVVPLNYEVVEISLLRNEDGSFTTVDGKDGAKVQVTAAAQRVSEFFSQEWRGGSAQITLPADIDPVQGDAAQFALVKDKLGAGSTNYGDSIPGRKKNIATGVSKIDGTVLLPGEEFSVLDVAVPFNEENGYALATSYAMGTVVESYGGGICQVSSTLYLAVLRAELEVTQRSGHSMTVGYVKQSMDAAIAEGVKDFKFRNNTDAPIYIHGYADGDEVGFAIYGHETRDTVNRKVSYESETLTTTEPEVKYEIDSTLSYGEKVVTSDGRTGYTAKLWKLITINGETTKEAVNSTTYQMTPKTIKIGTKDGDSEAVKALRDAAKANDSTKIDEVIAKYPGGKVPTPTEAPVTQDDTSTPQA